MTTVLGVFRNELGRVFALRPVASVMVIAAAVYALFYPQPYLNEALRKVPIAVVDQDRSQTSRELARLIDATPDVAVAEVAPDMPTAQREVYTRSIFGILLIPQHFERDLLHGRASPIALYADASYFLMYQRMNGAVTAVSRTMGTNFEVSRLVGLGVDLPVAEAATDPMPFIPVPLFNPQGGYATYILPAAFVLILQQTLLIGVGLLGTLPGAIVGPAGAARRRFSDMALESIVIVAGKLLAYLTVESLIVSTYLIGLPYLYGIPRLGSVTTILAFALPFTLAVGALGLLVAAVLRKPLAVQLVFAAIGLPFFFLAGFAWPVEAMPTAVKWLAKLLPSTLAIDGLVDVAQLGASLSDVRSEFLGLWLLVAAYAGIAVIVEFNKRRLAAYPGSDQPVRAQEVL
ncbi:ABC transporter permease [Bradyrhizobium sp. CER78]|uniref:ABC transporter permease n=1 Tax=Bradyrhizobium sp. CER78 TaxID=3039162 RepID=UPI002447E5BC|nr:ABC transporter permease [Bradyrhizobium sp. CER78]MDH2385498.1 ABC transporter permease [Bradyrhizobium sp. CER78]